MSYKEALRKHFDFCDFIENSKIEKYLIDLNKMPLEEKAKILYNHIYFNKLPQEYFSEVKHDKRYVDIIKHRNYNPRIIEYVTKKKNYSQCESAKYYDYILGKLENPRDVWADEFENRICSDDRIFMHTLYSLTDTHIEESILKTCFDKRIKNQRNYDSTIDVFSLCLVRLTESMVKIIDEKGKKKIGVINPSINDYIYNSLLVNQNEANSVLQEAIYIEQIIRISMINEELARENVISKIKSEEFLEMKSIEKNPKFYLLEFVYKNKYKSLMLKKDIVELIANRKTYVGRNLTKNVSSKTIKQILLDPELFEFYSLENLIFDFDKMKVIFDKLVFNDMCSILEIYNDYYSEDDDWSEELAAVIEQPLSACITDQVLDEIEMAKDDEICNTISQADANVIEDFHRGGSELITDVEGALEKVIEEIIDEKKKMLKKTFVEIEELVIDSMEILGELNCYDVIESYFRDEPDYDGYRNYSSGDDLKIAHEIFNRDYLSNSS